MNAVTQTETRAIETAAPLEVADPTKNLILVPLSQLLPRRSKRNARKTPRLSIPELAASIARIGLLQNLRHPVRRWRAIRSGGGRPPTDRVEAAGEEEAHRRRL